MRWRRFGPPGGSPRQPSSPRSPSTSRPRSVLAAHRAGDTVDRRVRLLIVPGPESRGGGGGGGAAARRRGRRVDRARERPPGPPVRRLLPGHHRPPGQSGVAGGHAAAGHHRLREGADRSLADRQLRQPARGGPPDRPVHLLLPRGARPTTATPGRWRACWPRWTEPAARSSKCSTTGWSRCPKAGAATSPRTTSPCAATCVRWTSCSRRGQLRPRWESAHLAAVVDEGVDGSAARDWSSTPSATRTGRSDPSSTGPRSARWSSPTATPDRMHGWKNAFDVGEWGLGRMVNSLALGCDCLGEITYLDAIFSSEHGNPYVVENAICIHEEDYGILWKHKDMNTGHTEVRRSRRLVVSSISTVGNYEYGFYWYFYLDGTIQLEVKLTGIMSTQAVAPGRGDPVRIGGGPGSGRPAPPAPVLRPARPRRRRPGQRGLRSLLRGHARRCRQPLGQRVPPAGDPAGVRAAGPTGRGPGQRPPLAVREPVGHQRPGPPGGLQAGPRPDPHPAAPGPTRASADGPDSPGTTSG